MRNQTERLFDLPGVLFDSRKDFPVIPANAGIQSGKTLTGFDTSADLDFLDSRVRGNDGEGVPVCCGFQNPRFTVKQPLFYTLSLLSPFERGH
jgi:hypothetical protein